jgi:hypothetical protein
MTSALNRLCKWRMVFASWQLGTRPKGDPECDAVRDHRELSIILRNELNALTRLLIEKGVFTAQERDAAVEAEAELLNKDYQRRFPGFRATDIGMDINTAIAADTMRGWKP